MNQLLEVIFRGRRPSGRCDLEAVETAVRRTMHRAGAAVVSELLSSSETVPRQAPCACGQQASYHDTRPKQFTTVVGEVRFERAYYVCSACARGQSPRHAEALGADIAGREQAEIQRGKQLQLPHVCAPAVPLLSLEMDGTGVPVVAAETAGRHGKREGQAARTRQVKLGCVFTPTTTDEQGRPLRDENSTTDTAASEGAEAFGLRLDSEAGRRGWSRARNKVLLGDGAVWIWNLADQHFPGAIQIVDLYHARQHLWELSAKLFPNQEQQRRRWTARLLRQLDQGQLEALVKPCASSLRRTRSRPACLPTRRTTSSAMPSGCGIPSFAAQVCLSARGWSRPAARR